MSLSEKALIETIQCVGENVPHIVKTPEFTLRRTHHEQVSLDKLHSLFNELQDPDEVFKYCGWSHHSKIDETKNFLDKRTEEWMNDEKYSYVIAKQGEYVGTTYIDVKSGGATFGLWLRKKFWGENLHGRVTDARIHVAFQELDLMYVDVGCLDYNEKSLRSITEYINRYGGSYYGSPLVSYSNYGGGGELVPHHEFVITQEQYRSSEDKIDTTIPGVEWSDTSLFDRVKR